MRENITLTRQEQFPSYEAAQEWITRMTDAQTAKCAARADGGSSYETQQVRRYVEQRYSKRDKTYHVKLSAWFDVPAVLRENQRDAMKEALLTWTDGRFDLDAGQIRAAYESASSSIVCVARG